MNQAKFAKVGFQSVTGTTILRGNRPTLSMLMTTAGLTFWISAPTAGSKRTFQTSPLWALASRFLRECLEVGQILIGVVLFLCQFGGGSQDPLLQRPRQLAQLHGRGRWWYGLTRIIVTDYRHRLRRRTRMQHGPGTCLPPSW